MPTDCKCECSTVGPKYLHPLFFKSLLKAIDISDWVMRLSCLNIMIWLLENDQIYLSKEPNSSLIFKNTIVLAITARILGSDFIIPFVDIILFTSFSEKRATFVKSKSAKHVLKIGRFFSIKYQLRPHCITSITRYS